MKILELRLHAFGPFTDRVLDFSAGQEGLHLVMGPNEAGKSSALRALKQALFKIPVQSTDDFIHPYRKLQIGLKLRNADGREINLVRRKGSANTLLDEMGKPVPESQLALILNGLSEAAFSQRFALDHDELTRGGKSIVEGKGELGEVLFQASGGVHDLLETRKQMRLELEELFKPSGTKPRINAQLAALKQAKEIARERSLPSARWLEHEANRNQAAAELGEVERRLTSHRAEKNRLQRVLRAIPLFNKRRGWCLKREELSAVPILDDDFSQRRDTLEKTRIRAQAELDAATRSLEEIDRELMDLVVPESLLADADRVKQLSESLTEFRKLVKSLPRERETLRSAEIDIQRMLTDLDARNSEDWLAAARSMSLSRSRKSAIKALGREHAGRVTERASLTEKITELEIQIRLDQDEWNRLGTMVSTDSLASALAEANDQGDLEKRANEARARLERLALDAMAALARLPLWSGSLEALVSLPVPTSQTLDRFEADSLQVQELITTTRQQLFETRKLESQALAELDRLRQAIGELPSEDDLIAARQRRDRLWSNVRSSWVAMPTTSQHGADEAAKLADDYEQAVIDADALADRLRREAARIAEQATARSKLDQAHRDLKALELESAAAAANHAAIKGEWSALWNPHGIAPLTPREMQAWLGDRRELTRIATELQNQRDQVNSLEHLLINQKRSLVRNLQLAGETSELGGETLSVLKELARKRITGFETSSTKREGLARSIATQEVKLETARGRLRAIDDEDTNWRDSWRIAVAPLGLDGRATPEHTESVIERIDDLMKRVDDADAARTRLEALERDRDRFLRILAEDDQAVLDELIDLQTAASQARELIQEYERAVKLKEQRDGLIERRTQERAKVAAAALELESRKPWLAELCREAQVADPTLLPLAERQSREAKTAREQVADLDEQLAVLAGHETVASFEESALAGDVDRLPDEIAALDHAITELEAKKDALNQTLGHERSQLALMNGGDEGAEAAQQAEALIAGLAQDVEDYARMQLASAVLDQVVEQHRKKNQVPVLDRAGKLFSRLTLGAFMGLDVFIADDGKRVLRAIRATSNDFVQVDGLSAGTADQLFLALRLASLEVTLENQPPLPLLLDDVLIQFDDRRAMAALSVLGELSTRAQIVLFSHHEHLLALAEAQLDPATLFVHRLP